MPFMNTAEQVQALSHPGLIVHAPETCSWQYGFHDHIDMNCLTVELATLPEGIGTTISRRRSTCGN